MNFIPLGIWDSIGAGLDAMMQPIYWAISGILVGFHSIFSKFMDPNMGWTWVLSIVSLTAVIRTLMIPLFVRQINTSRRMQLLGPKLKALQDKYKSDQERLGQETMKLYREENVNPMASCLPMLLQMPIFIGLFNVLNAVSRHGGDAPLGHFFVKNPDLAWSLQRATIFGAPVSGTFSNPAPASWWPWDWASTQWVAAFLILAMTVSLFITQYHMMRKNMPPESLQGPMAQQQKTMLYMFPAMYLFFGLNVAIGVMIYWFASNMWTLVQQFILIRNSPTPNTPAYIDWEERMKAKGKDPEAILAKRMGMNKKKSRDVKTSATGVVRQATGRATSADASDKPQDKQTSSTEDNQGGRVVRRQPTRQARSTRKQAKPKNR